jgi:hypothetical protein
VEKGPKSNSGPAKRPKRERDERGRFLPGHTGGPGRPPRKVEASYLAGLTDLITPQVWEGIVRRAAADALRGSHQARAWLSGYLLGDVVATATGPVEVVPLVTADDALQLLSKAAALTLAGDVRRGTALGSLAMAASRLIEVADLAEKLAAIERQLAQGGTK